MPTTALAPSSLGVLYHPVDRVPAAVLEQLGVLADLALAAAP